MRPELAFSLPRHDVVPRPFAGAGRYYREAVDLTNGNVTYSVFYSVDRFDHNVEAGVEVWIRDELAATVECVPESATQTLGEVIASHNEPRPVDPGEVIHGDASPATLSPPLDFIDPEPVANRTYLVHEVDDPVELISRVQPRYPPILQQAGVSGRVEMEYVVSTEGRAELESFKILSSTDRQFEEPAREAILRAVFRPARVRGQPVRQLVRQALSFNSG